MTSSCAVSCALVGLSMPLCAHGANKLWTAAVSGDFGDAANWTGGVPGAADNANFLVSGTYTVTFDNSPNPLPNPVLNQILSVGDGNVTFASGVGGPYTYQLTGGGSDAIVTVGTLTLGSGGNPLHMTVDDDLVVQSGATLFVNSGSVVNTLDLRLGHGGVDGYIFVDGSGSQLNVSGTTTQSLGLNGNRGVLTFQNASSGSFSGQLDVGVSSTAGTLGFLNVFSGAQLNIANLAVGSGTAGSGTVNVGGAGSTLVQAGDATLTVGAASGTTGALNIGTGVTGATLTTGTGLFIINSTGTVNIGSAITAGTLNANGNVLVDGGSITRTGGAINLAAGRTLTAQNNAQINLGSSTAVLSGGTTWNINSGADLTSTDLVHIGTSAGTTTVTLDGVGSSMNVGTASGGATWGGNGTANVTFRNGASANIVGGIGLAFVPAAGVSGTINVESDADVVMRDLQINNSGGATESSGTVTVTGTGSTLTQSGASQLILGQASGGTATINLTNNANYTTGTGITRVNATGMININPGAASFGTFDVNGDILVDGGTIQRQSGFFSWSANKIITIQNGGDVILGGLGTGATGNTINVTGNGSLLSVTGGYVQLQSGSQLNVTGGGDHSAFNFRVGIGSGTATALVDGIGSTIVATSSSTMGASGGTANVTFQNNAAGSLNTTSGTLQLASDGIAGSAANVNVLSGADLIARSLEMANNGVGSATLTIDGSGSTFSQVGTASITLGHASTGSAVINVRNSATFNTGTGLFTINKTGTVNIGSATTAGTLNANGDVVVDGGSITPHQRRYQSRGRPNPHCPEQRPD